MHLVTAVRHAVRTFARAPLFALTSIGSLAIGIGACATMFSLADALFLRPRPGLVDEARLVDVARSTDGQGFDNLGYPVLRALQGATQLEGLAGYRLDPSPVSLEGGDGAAERVFAAPVTGNYFEVLGTRPALGRFFRHDEDEVPDRSPVAVLSHAFWRRRFEASPDVVGQSLRLNGRPYAIIGVAEAGFEGTTITGADVWVPFAMAPHVTGRGGPALLTAHGPVWHLAIGRMKPGVGIGQVRDELNARLAPLKAAHPDAYGRWSIATLPSARVPGEMRGPVMAFVATLFALTGLVLAIACSNVAGMLLARAVDRRREVATRLAVGASRGQIVAQLLIETLVLFAGAAAGGVLLAWWLTRLVHGFVPALPVPISVSPAIDLRVVAFALAATGATAIVFGLVPARQATALRLAATLHGQHATGDRRGLRLRLALVGGQVALSVVLLVTTGLLVRTLASAARIDTGYDGARVRVVSVETSMAGYQGPAAAAVADRLLASLAALDGVEAVATSRMIPLQGGTLGLGRLRVPGYVSAQGDETFRADWDVVSPGYFDVLGVPVQSGRAFTGVDRDGAPLVAVVNETFARQAWPGREAVGQVVLQQTGRTPDTERPLTVVGVARDAQYRTVGESPRPFIYVPLAQQPMTELHLYVRQAPGRTLGEAIARALAAAEPGLPVLLHQSFDEAVGIGLVPQRFAAAVAGAVGGIGLLLTAIGLYGLMAVQVARRGRELAIRMALGASAGQVRRMVLRQAAAVGGSGALTGGLLAWATARAMSNLLIGVTSFDVMTFAATAVVLAGTLAAAAWGPARRAASVDPATTLRSE